MNIHLPTHYGMCFGVRDALALTEKAAARAPITVLGQLVHNPVVSERLSRMGARLGELDDPSSSQTSSVVITAHGAADTHRHAWREAGFELTDTTCPLVRRAHEALRLLVAGGWHPVVLGKADHVEVRGLTGDFPGAIVVETEADLPLLRGFRRIGMVSQTTQPHARALALAEAVKTAFPAAETRFVDTVCQPTRRRQKAVEDLARDCDLVIVIGGENSHNTAQLAATAKASGAQVRRIERAADLRPEWWLGRQNVGVTAGTSTLEETVREVVRALEAAGGVLVRPARVISV